jgi:hypothetical protein
MASEDRGDVLRGYPVKVEVDSGQIGRLPRLRERLSGPRHARGAMVKAALGPLRCRRHTTQALAPTASPNGGTCNHRYHDQEDVNELGHGGLPVGVVPAAPRAGGWGFRAAGAEVAALPRHATELAPVHIPGGK